MTPFDRCLDELDKLASERGPDAMSRAEEAVDAYAQTLPEEERAEALAGLRSFLGRKESTSEEAVAFLEGVVAYIEKQLGEYLESS